MGRAWGQGGVAGGQDPWQERLTAAVGRDALQPRAQPPTAPVSHSPACPTWRPCRARRELRPWGGASGRLLCVAGKREPAVWSQQPPSPAPGDSCCAEGVAGRQRPQNGADPGPPEPQGSRRLPGSPLAAAVPPAADVSRVHHAPRLLALGPCGGLRCRSVPGAGREDHAEHACHRRFWSAYTPCDTQNKDAVKRTLEQIDVIHRMCAMYPDTFAFVTDSAGVREAFRKGQVASLVGVEGGHSLDSSLGVLRALYRLGMRYMTLTHSCNTPWADNWLVDTGEDRAQSQGLSKFGQSVLREMNRLGVIVDLAHVSLATMKAALELSTAPVIFSHSSAFSVCAHHRNVPDSVLQLVKQKNSLVMVNFYNDYVSCRRDANLSQVADHLDHIKKVAGPGAVGLGGDFDGVTRLPVGLEDVSKYPDLIAELFRRGWTDAEVQGALAENLLRVFQAVEQASNHSQPPEEDPIALDQLEGSCRTNYGYSAAPQFHCPSGALLASLVALLVSLRLL